MIEIRKLTKKYRDLTAVNNISFTIEKGEILGFLGRNGAGKTTTMRMITGYLSPTSGAVYVDGLNVFDEPLVVKKKIGYLPETPPVYMDMTVDRYLRFVADLKALPYRDVKKEIARVSDQCGITQVSHRLIRHLSKGYRQRVGLAQALLGSPSVLILDEPTVGLDVAQIREVRSLIKELAQDHTVILSTHILPEVQMICNRVSIIHQGSIVASDTIENLSRGMNQDVRVRVELTESNSKAAAQLQAIEGVDRVEELLPGQQFDLILADPTLADGKLFNILAESDLSLRQCHNVTPTLEDIFLRVVSGEDAAAAPTDASMAAITEDVSQEEEEEAVEAQADDDAEEAAETKADSDEETAEGSAEASKKKKKRKR